MSSVPGSPSPTTAEWCVCGHPKDAHGKWLQGRYDCCSCDTYIPRSQPLMADTDRPDLDAAEKILDFPCGLPKYDQRQIISYARSLESQLAEKDAEVETALTKAEADVRWLSQSYERSLAQVRGEAVRLADEARIRETDLKNRNHLLMGLVLDAIPNPLLAEGESQAWEEWRQRLLEEGA